MGGRAILKTWLALLVLSALSTLYAERPPQGDALAVGAAGLLLVTLAKARAILSVYLGLAVSPAWQQGATLVLLAYLALLGALYLAPVLA